jgi:hypothetical protein
MALMSTAEARQLSDEFRPQFSSAEAFETSWRNCFERLKTPSLESARRWLQEDLRADGIMASGLRPEPLLPVRSSYAPNECRHCRGRGYVREELPIDSAGFGVARPCPACTDSAHKERCEVCRNPVGFSGYFGPETATVPADFSPSNPDIPADWTPRHARARAPIPAEVWEDLERLRQEKSAVAPAASSPPRKSRRTRMDKARAGDQGR